MPSKDTERPQIAIVGLLPGQQRVLEKAIGQHLSLRFFGTPDGRAIGSASSVTRVYLLTRFANHGLTQRVQSRFADVVLCHGGLCRLLRRIAADFEIPLEPACDNHD